MTPVMPGGQPNRETPACWELARVHFASHTAAFKRARDLSASYQDGSARRPWLRVV